MLNSQNSLSGYKPTQERILAAQQGQSQKSGNETTHLNRTNKFEALSRTDLITIFNQVLTGKIINIKHHSSANIYTQLANIYFGVSIKLVNEDLLLLRNIIYSFRADLDSYDTTIFSVIINHLDHFSYDNEAYAVIDEELVSHHDYLQRVVNG